MKRRTTIVLATAITMLALSACTPSERGPTSSPSAAETVAPTPAATATAGTIPVQSPTPAPVDQTSAILAANNAYQGYLSSLLDLIADPSLGAQYMSGYVLPGSPEAQDIERTVQTNLESGLRASGGPFKWQMNEAMSYAAPVTDTATGERNEIGSVQLFGCSDNTNISFTNPDVPRGVFPYNVTLIYVAAQQAWLVQTESYLRPGTEGAPQC